MVKYSLRQVSIVDESGKGKVYQLNTAPVKDWTGYNPEPLHLQVSSLILLIISSPAFTAVSS